MVGLMANVFTWVRGHARVVQIPTYAGASLYQNEMQYVAKMQNVSGK